MFYSTLLQCFMASLADRQSMSLVRLSYLYLSRSHAILFRSKRESNSLRNNRRAHKAVVVPKKGTFNKRARSQCG